MTGTTQDRSQADYWLARWQAQTNEEFQAQWREDYILASEEGADAVELDRLRAFLRTRLHVGARALDRTLTELLQGQRLQNENSHIAHAHRWIAQRERAGGFMAGPGCFYYSVGEDPIWRTMPFTEARAIIGQELPRAPMCTSWNDYGAIAKLSHAVLNASSTTVMRPPLGVAINDQCAFIEGRAVKFEPLSREHWCRFRIQAELMPTEGDHAYAQFLAAVAPRGSPDWEDIRLALGQAAALILFGLGNVAQRAILFLGEPSSGKSTAQAIMSALVAEDALCSVPPEDWNREYARAMLSRAALNVVEDLDYRTLLTNMFKRIVGNQTQLSARDPYGVAYTFVPNVTHLFSANEYIGTKVNDKGFWRRWLLVVFRNVVAEANQVDRLADIVRRDCLGAVVQHAIDSVPALVDAHGSVRPRLFDFQKAAMEAWENRENLVKQFLTDEEWMILGKDQEYSRAGIYEAFVRWSDTNGFGRAMNHYQFAHRLEKIGAAMGLKLIKKKNRRVWKGVGPAPDQGATF